AAGGNKAGHSDEDARYDVHCPGTGDRPALVAHHYDSASGLALTRFLRGSAQDPRPKHGHTHLGLVTRSNRTELGRRSFFEMRLGRGRPPGEVVRAWCPKRGEEDVLWVRVAA